MKKWFRAKAPEFFFAVPGVAIIPILPGEQTFVRPTRYITYTDDGRHAKVVRVG